MQLFKGLDKVEISGNSKIPRLTAGEFVLKIEDVTFLKTRRKGDAFIVEYSVVESSDLENHPIGARRSWYRDMKEEDLAQKQIAKLMWAIYGYDPKRDKERAEQELVPVINQRCNEACTPNDNGEKLLNGKGILVRASVWKGDPNAKELALAKAEAREPRRFENITFSPFSKDPPPAPGQSR